MMKQLIAAMLCVAGPGLAAGGVEEIDVVAPARTADSIYQGWSEYRSAHFLVDTDFSELASAELVRHLESMLALELATVASAAPPPLGRIRVLASSSAVDDIARDEFFVTVDRRPWGKPYLWPEYCDDFVNRFSELTLVLPVKGSSLKAEVVAHALAHALGTAFFIRPPAWLREGFAQYVGTLGALPVPNGAVTGSHVHLGPSQIPGAMGLMTPAMRVAVARDDAQSRDLWTWDGQESVGRPERFHAGAWLLYRLLWNERSRELSDFEARLANGEPSDAAWTAAFPEFNPSREETWKKLDRALAGDWSALQSNVPGYAPTLHAYRPTQPVDFDPSYAVAKLPPGQVHALLLDARHGLTGEPSGEALHHELSRVLEEEPIDPQALAWSADLGITVPVARYRKSTARYPADWRAWLALAGASPDASEREAALRKAVALEPENALAQGRLARELATQGKLADAVPIAQRAVRLAPWDARFSSLLARIAAELGQCEEALGEQVRALRLAAVKETPPDADLDEVARWCGPRTEP
jgi:tetratricopeptide (TPR) repeat protein